MFDFFFLELFNALMRSCKNPVDSCKVYFFSSILIFLPDRSGLLGKLE